MNLFESNVLYSIFIFEYNYLLSSYSFFLEFTLDNVNFAKNITVKFQVDRETIQNIWFESMVCIC